MKRKTKCSIVFDEFLRNSILSCWLLRGPSQRVILKGLLSCWAIWPKIQLWGPLNPMTSADGACGFLAKDGVPLRVENFVAADIIFTCLHISSTRLHIFPYFLHIPLYSFIFPSDFFIIFFPEKCLTGSVSWGGRGEGPKAHIQGIAFSLYKGPGTWKNSELSLSI